MRRHQEFFSKENGKNEFVSKFKEIKQNINSNSFKSSKATSSSKNFSPNNFIKGNANKQMFIKKNVDLMLPKKKEILFSSFNGIRKDNKLTLNSSKTLLKIDKIPDGMYNKIKKTMPEYLNSNSIRDIFFDRSDNKLKIEKMKEKVNKFFK